MKYFFALAESLRAVLTWPTKVTLDWGSLLWSNNSIFSIERNGQRKFGLQTCELRSHCQSFSHGNPRSPGTSECRSKFFSGMVVARGVAIIGSLFPRSRVSIRKSRRNKAHETSVQSGVPGRNVCHPLVVWGWQHLAWEVRRE